jgi:UDP-N-acetylglucosamine--N-acetylmuramyl-(pentapeptide) pyrophosphoryl-undecaprenol N-acetylglucosamine transferase
MRKLIKEQGSVDKEYAIFAGKWRRYHGVGVLSHLKDVKTVLKNIRDVFLFCFGLLQSFFILIFWRPDVVFVKGGYVGLPVGLASALLRVPIVTHDSDSIPGLTNRILSRYARLQAVGLPVDLYSDYYLMSKLRFTGVPIKPDFFNLDAQAELNAEDRFGINKGSKVVAFIGGSLGAVRLNEAILLNLRDLLRDQSIYVLWVTGAHQHEDIIKRIADYGLDKNRLKIFAFTDQIHNILAAADVVVSRAGATSIAELAAAAKPTILVPNPYLTGGHQLKNARSLADSGTVLVVTEKQLSDKPTILSEQIFNLFTNNLLRQKLSRNFYSLAVPDATKRIVDTLDEAVKL